MTTPTFANAEPLPGRAGGRAGAGRADGQAQAERAVAPEAPAEDLRAFLDALELADDDVPWALASTPSAPS